MSLPSHAPFEPNQKQALDAVLPTLTTEQSTWLSAFLAGLSTPSGQAPAASKKLTVLFGSESGNTESLAATVKSTADKAGFTTKVENMADAKIQNLAKEENLLILISTWGEGDPPDNATEYYAAFMSDAAPKLTNTRFSVLALGDTSYTHFCKMGKDFDQRLEALGGTRIYPRQDCDVDYEDAFDSWLKGALAALVEATAGSAAAPVTTGSTASSAPAAGTFSKKNPFPSKLNERILLNGRGSSKETLHLEFSLEGSGLTYDAGDALALIPTNCPEVVDEIVKLGSFNADEVVPVGKTDEAPLQQALFKGYDITGLTGNTIKKYNAFAESAELTALTDPANKEKLQEYIYGREISDLLADYPVKGLKATDFVSVLRKLPPRLYSIASSLKAHPDEVHLTIAVVRYNSHGKDRKGVASSFVADRIALGETAQIYTHANKNFKLPTDGNTPIIMVGPGTGIAPFRSFIEERGALGATGKNWLFFGDQHYLYDFLYQTEWQGYLKDGLLNKLDLAFSRDQKQKVYVQGRMLEQSKELYAWLEEGAHFYVCGDASRMAHDVNEALITIVEKEGGRSREDAEAYVSDLKKAKRYQRDVY